MNKKYKPKGKLSVMAEELMGFEAMIELHSDYEAIVSGCKGISCYSSDEILLSTVSGSVKISGYCLYISYFRCEVLAVCGKIISVSYV